MNEEHKVKDLAHRWWPVVVLALLIALSIRDCEKRSMPSPEQPDAGAPKTQSNTTHFVVQLAESVAGLDFPLGSKLAS